ncbi:predicted protein [Histoplasma mississippiense (nom. inval.)]|uniref:predicted protein n=1 Tax=Ajellomyces capsulatus (strain NAm1 / WU24) TaxID=2059318 RepID=UPI000157C42A|nr:predicted protein [Histoplasma mississippiense (nom. inval.)]EDN07744.1 predicted protein [Histoplasma mississippiense (nom. inval.)]
MASLQSTFPNNNTTSGKDSNNTPDIHPNYTLHSPTSAPLATAREDEATPSRSRPTSTVNHLIIPCRDVVKPKEASDQRQRGISTSSKTAAAAAAAATIAIGNNNNENYEDVTELVDLAPLPASDHSDDHDRDTARNRNNNNNIDIDNDNGNGSNHSSPSSASSISSGSVRLVVQRTRSTQRSGTSGDSVENMGSNTGILGGVKRFWFRHVSMTVPRRQNRDHFVICFSLRPLCRRGWPALVIPKNEPASSSSKHAIHQSIKSKRTPFHPCPLDHVQKFGFHELYVLASGEALERTFLAYIRTSLAFAFQGALIAQLFSLQNRQDQDDTPFGFHAVGKPLACGCHACAIAVAAVGSYRFWRQQNALARGKVHAGGWELGVSGACAAGIIAAAFVLVVLITARK